MTESLRKVYEDAKQGNAEAQLRIGDCYFWGYGTEKNSAEARDWYKKATEQGSAVAQCALGDYFRRFERDDDEAEACYRKAAEQGYAAAQHKLGLYYCDADKAIEWYRKAAEQGYAKAQCTLGDCYYNGEGIEKDLKEAVKWYRKAAELGLAEAQWRLGNCYHKGKGIGKNQKEAEKWRTKAAEQGYRDLYSKEECADRVKEAEEEYSIAMKSEEGESEWFEHIIKAALLRYPKAAFALGRHYYENGKWETGLRWISTAISALWGENYKNWRPKESRDGKLDEDEVLMFLLRKSGFTTQLDSIDDREWGDWIPDYKKALEYLGYFYDTYSYLRRNFHSGIKQPPIKADDMFVEPPMFDGEYAEHNWAGAMAHALYLNNHNYGGFSDWSPLCLDEFDVLVDSGILPNEEFLQGGIYDSMECDEDMVEDDYERYQVYSTRGGAHGGGYSDAIDSLGGYLCCVSHGKKSEEDDSTEENCENTEIDTKEDVKENFDLQTVKIIDIGDYIELSPAIGNIRMIAKEKSPEELTWNEAFDYAKKLRTGGFSDWRLPTEEELEMIYEIRYRCGIRDTDWFWSSTISNDKAQCWDFDDGDIGYVHKDNTSLKNYVRCVRSGEESTVQIVDKGDYIELSPAIGNIRMIAKEKSPKELTWNEAFDYAKKLRAGGFSDWRVPTKEELEIIYKIKDLCGILDKDWFWSSSTKSDNTDYAWCVDFYGGYVGNVNEDNVCYVRCVRSGEESEEEDHAEENFDPQAVKIVDKGDYIELSPAIGNIRMIAKEKSPEELTWNEAFDYAKNLRTGGFSDWRVPTKEELEMIYKIKDRCGISDSDWFWSSSTPSDDTDNAWLVHFSYGFVGSNDKTCNYNVRCVR